MEIKLPSRFRVIITLSGTICLKTAQMAAQDYYPSTGLNLKPPVLMLATLSIRLRWNCLLVVVWELAVSYIIITLSPQNGLMEIKLPSRIRVIITLSGRYLP